MPTPPHAALVYNPVKVDATRLRSALEARSQEAGWAAPHLYETSVDDPGVGQARRAVLDGAQVVLVAGGDGTVRAVAEGLRGSGVPLTLIPSGTGNLLARNLKLPLGDQAAAIGTAFTGDTRAIDIGVAMITRADGSEEEHAFVVMAGMGIDAMMIATANPDLKKSLGWLAYVESGLRSIATAAPFRIQYQLRGHRQHAATVSSVLVGNCGTLQGGVQLMPDAELDDGFLDVAVLQPKGAFGWLLVWRKVTWENRVLRRTAVGRRMIRFTEGRGGNTVTNLRAEALTVRVDEAQDLELDGDAFGMATMVAFDAHRGGLLVTLP
ncbi:Diacylglycerol kinase family enzyme [Plantibacter sp. VKM Ac-1784]|uniref:Diacylglycerol kinase family enzyme n=1 Tax=Plantibacter elymi (nom. nud.) TaxID=199708 RepID=A0ABY1RIN2_9MICO|nr:diacylglycerol kinase family protein [Plantibacter sp. VKM Ac-1784]SMQ75259.1 Diacylglycerol kinase family enzyme [Plantibacter sp. VKM Ac-1784]